MWGSLISFLAKFLLYIHPTTCNIIIYTTKNDVTERKKSRQIAIQLLLLIVKHWTDWQELFRTQQTEDKYQPAIYRHFLNTRQQSKSYAVVKSSGWKPDKNRHRQSNSIWKLFGVRGIFSRKHCSCETRKYCTRIYIQIKYHSSPFSP